MEVTKIPKKRISVIEPKQSIIVDKAKYEQLRVAAYCRVSTDNDEQITSYKNQMKFYTEMINAKKEWKFADVGVGSSQPYFVGNNEPFFAGKLGANQ